MSRNDTYPQHVVTAVIVAHDGAPWLPHVIDALLGQTRPVQRVVAVDTGSRDRSGGMLAAKLGQQVVFGMDRATGYATAVARALQHKAASVPVAAPPATGARGQARGRDDRVEWIWLLHDDSEPAPDALEQLLRGAAESPQTAVFGPKVMDWTDREVILEAGLTIDNVGRRITGIEPREHDQGQHDGDRDTVAVSSTGMLVRRDVWDQVGGFDTSMALFREDIDFCWRVHAAGYRVRVITDAVVYHAQAVTRRRRAVSVGRRTQLLDRRNGLITLAGNLPSAPMLRSMAANVGVSFLRILFFLLAKRVTAALDESAAVASVVCHPLRLMRVRRMRARGRKAAYARLRADLPRGRSLRRIAEFAAAMSGSAQQDTTGSHHATEDPDEADDFLLTDSGLAQRLLTHPGVLFFLGLAVVTGVAERSLLGAGTLAGGALLPAGGAASLWHQYLLAFHPTGVGSPSVAPPYLAIMAILATLLTGKAWLAVDVVLLGSVPMAGMGAYLAVRRVTTSVPVRIWAAATYALIPVAAGAISGGRLGTAAVFALIPLIGLQAGRMFSLPPKLARRAAWAAGLLVAVAAAFVPLVWLIALLAAAVAAVLRRHQRGLLVNLGIAVVVPPVLLIPWTFQLAAHPSTLLLEVGVQQPGLASPDLPARSLMLLSPGGPGLPPAWVTAGLIVAALVALLAAPRRALVLSGWTVAVLGLLLAIPLSRISVRPPAGGPAVTVWSGAALAIAGAGLLLAAAAGGDSLAALVKGDRSSVRRLTGVRRAGVAVLALVACTAPVAAAAFWLRDGISGPVGPARGQAVPALVSSASSDAQTRILVLRSAGAGVSYQLLRGSGLTLGDADLTPVPAAQSALRTAVASLAAPSGGQAVNQAQILARLDIGFVLMRTPINQGLASTLDAVAGLRPVSMTANFDLWRLATLPARASVLERNGAVVPIPSGQVSVVGASAPAAGGTLLLAEPAGGWTATLNGQALAAVPSPSGSWAQAFRLPSGGGTLDISPNGLGHDLGLIIELIAALIVAALALPGVRTPAEALPAEAALPETATAEREPAAEDAGYGDRDAAGAETAVGVLAGVGRDGGRYREYADAEGYGGYPGTAARDRADGAHADPAGGGDGDPYDDVYAGLGRAAGRGGDEQYADDEYDEDEYAGAESAGGRAPGRLGRGRAGGKRGGRGGKSQASKGPDGKGPDSRGPGGKGLSRGLSLGRGLRRPKSGAAPVPGTSGPEPAADDRDWDEAAARDGQARDWDDSGPLDLPALPGGPGQGGGAYGRPSRDTGARSPSGAWPYPDDAEADEPPGRPYPAGSRQPASPGDRPPAEQPSTRRRARSDRDPVSAQYNAAPAPHAEPAPHVKPAQYAEPAQFAGPGQGPYGERDDQPSERRPRGSGQHAGPGRRGSGQRGGTGQHAGPGRRGGSDQYAEPESRGNPGQYAGPERSGGPGEYGPFGGAAPYPGPERRDGQADYPGPDPRSGQYPAQDDPGQYAEPERRSGRGRRARSDQDPVQEPQGAPREYPATQRQPDSAPYAAQYGQSDYGQPDYAQPQYPDAGQTGPPYGAQDPYGATGSGAAWPDTRRRPDEQQRPGRPAAGPPAAGPPAGGWSGPDPSAPRPPGQRPGPAAGRQASWGTSPDTGGWPAVDQAGYPVSDQPRAWPGGNPPPDRPAGARGGPQRPGPQRPGAQRQGPPPDGPMPGGQPAWQADGEQDDWAGAGESLEPLPSAQTRHGVTDDRSRRRWPAPDADESDEGNAW